MAPSLLLAPSFVVLMISIHHYAPEDKKIWSHIGVAFAIIYAVLVSIVYYSQMTFAVPHIQRGEADQVALLLMDWGSFIFTIDVLGYGFMHLATLFAAFVFTGSKLERWIRWALVANGTASSANLFWFIPGIWYIAMVWAVTFPLATAMLAVLFRRAGAEIT